MQFSLNKTPGFFGLTNRHNHRIILKLSSGHPSLKPGAFRKTKDFRLNYDHVPLAQLDRVCGYEPQGRGFKSLTAHHTCGKHSRAAGFFMLAGNARAAAVSFLSVDYKKSPYATRVWTLFVFCLAFQYSKPAFPANGRVAIDSLWPTYWTVRS